MTPGALTFRQVMYEHCDNQECRGSDVPPCQRSCLICGYDLRGNLHGERCPECGAAWPKYGDAPGEPTAASSLWRLWVPFSKRVRLIWLLPSAHAGSRTRTRSWPWVAAATLMLAAAAYCSSWTVHRVEWVFASIEPIEPQVEVFADSGRRPKSPSLLSTSEISGVYSFGSRSGYFRLGHSLLASGQESSTGVSPIYWNSTGLRSRVVLPNIPVRRHVVEQNRVAPSMDLAISTIARFAPLAILAWCVNTLCLPRLLRRVNHSDSACRPVLRHGFHHVSRATFAWLVLVSGIWILAATSPANLFVDFRLPGLWIARTLFIFAFLGPAVIAIRGILCDPLKRVFGKRALSLVIAATCHAGIIGLYLFITVLLSLG